MLDNFLGQSFIVFILILVNKATAQTPLNVVSDFGYHQQNIRSILVSDNDLYVSGIALRKNNDQEREFFISRINHQLEPENHFLLDDVNGLLTLQNEGHDLVSHLGRLYTVASEVDFSNTQGEFASVIEFDPNTNSLSYYIQEDTLINGFPLFPSTLISDVEKDDILVLYNTFADTQLNSILIIRYDRSTKLIKDEFAYGEVNASISGFEIIKRNVGYTLIGRRQYLNGDPSEIIVFNLSDALDLESSITLDQYNYSDIYTEAVQSPDGGLTFLTAESIGEFPRDSFRKKVIKLDPNLNFEWEVTLGNPNYTRDFLTTTEIVNSSQDDGYLICGSLEHGVIDKISEKGDSVWFRTFEPLNEDKALFSDFADIVTTDVGEYVAAGRSAPENFATDSIFSKMWIVKINEDGHIIDRDTTGVSTIEAFNGQLRIFPNPTAEVLYIEQDNLRAINYELYNQQGQLVLQKGNTRAYHTYMISLHNYASGVYYLHTIDKEQNRSVNEIVIQK